VHENSVDTLAGPLYNRGVRNLKSCARLAAQIPVRGPSRKRHVEQRPDVVFSFEELE